MRTTLTKLVCALLVSLAAAAAPARPSAADDGGRPFRLALSGANEVNAAGAPSNSHDDDDRGSAVLTLNQGQGEVCWSFGPITLTEGDALPHVAHIHRAPAGASGPAVVDIFGGSAPVTAPASYPTGTTCVPAAAELIKDIRQNPAAYYLNLHNAQHPAGVMRAQLSG